MSQKFLAMLLLLGVLNFLQINGEKEALAKLNILSRKGGNLLRNLTGTQVYENHIVTSTLDNSYPIRMIYRGMREVYNKDTGSRHASERFQKIVSNKKKFPCDVRGFRSKTPPKSVHKLRPGDIDVIASVGDSLTSATAANSRAIWEVMVENRGLSWCIGGQGNWRTHLTLPNILKEFNSNLFGYSTADSYNVHRGAQFNIAENIATTSDMPYNAKKLMQRMEKDSRVNMKKHWKILTFMIGGNDFCSDVCYQTNATHWINEEQEKNLIKSLKYLKKTSPRTIVNLVPSPLISLSFSMDTVDTPFTCALARPLECSCLFGPKYSNHRNLYRKLERRFVRIMEKVSYMPELHSDDFTVVYQPFFKDASVFYRNDRMADLNIMAIDCVHLSQKGHAVSANGLWNNMMEPVGLKSLGLGHLFETFKCPSRRNPYIYTNYNSNF